MKINRQNLTEDYSSCSTADWISDFSKSLEKNADYMDNLKSIMKQRKDFSSIDEKMADIKDRAGFNLIKDVNNSDTAKVASEIKPDVCCCKRNNCQKCNPEIFKSLKTIINYIKDFIKDRPDVGLLGVLTHCRQHPTLGFRFQRIESKIDNKKFKALAEKIIGDKSVEDEVRYIPEEFSSEEDSAGDMADYMAHAQTG